MQFHSHNMGMFELNSNYIEFQKKNPNYRKLMPFTKYSVGFGNLASCTLQRFVGFFCMGVGESIMDTRDHF